MTGQVTELERLRKLVVSWLEEEPRGKTHQSALRVLDAFEHEVRRDERRIVLAETDSESANRGVPDENR